MRILFYIAFALEHVSRMEVRNFTHGLISELPQFWELSPPNRLPVRNPATSCVVSLAVTLYKFYQNVRAPA